MFSEHGPDIGHAAICQKVGGREPDLEQARVTRTDKLVQSVSVMEPHIYTWSESITQTPILLKAAGYFLKPIIVIL